MKYTVIRSHKKQFIKKNKKGSPKSYGFILYCLILPQLNWNLKYKMFWHFRDSPVLGKHKFYIYNGFN